MTRHSPIITLVCCLLLTAGSSRAQQYDIIDQLRNHPEFLDGTDYLCPTEPTRLSRAPKGYKPFYISHYGRHGARYAWQSDMYSRLNTVFSEAEKAGNLTELGLSYKRRFDSLYPSVRYRTGDLSRKGFRQQEALSRRMVKNFRKVFGKGATVRSWTSTSTRCAMTMSAFCLGLKAMRPRMDIFENFGVSFLPAILPLDRSNPFREQVVPQTPVKFEEKWPEYIERTVDYKAILGRLFKDTDAAVPEDGQWSFTSYLYFFAAGMKSLDTDLDFTDIFTPDERIALWKIDDFQFYAEAWPTHLGYFPIVKDIIIKADERIASGEKGADLRFGHDYTFLPLLMTLDVNGFGHEVTNPDDIPTWCQLHEVPMGANLQLVFYRSRRRNRNVLFKVLLNGKEASLPLETDNWPYYDWEAFKEHYYLPSMGEVAEIVDTKCEEVSGLCLSPDGSGMLAASDEKGIYRVSWTGETSEFYTEKELDCEGVTIDPDTKDVYYIVEGKQEIRRLKAPDYSNPELLTVIKNDGYGTNNGLEGITWFKDGTLLVGNQFSPNLLMRYSLTDGIIGEWTITDTKEIAGLCYDPARDVLWIADSIDRTINLCTLEGKVIASYPVPFIDNGESLFVDHDRECIWVGDDTTSKLYKIHFSGL